MKDQIVKAMNWRYAVKAYDKDKKVSKEDLETILEVGRLAPSSFGIEAWKFLVIENPELREKIKGAAYGQTQVTDASYLIVVTQRTDIRENIARELVERTAKATGKSPEDLAEFNKMISGSIQSRTDDQLLAWARSQTYIALGAMVEAAALLGVDASSMEGFNPAEVDKILGLKEKNLASVTLFEVGYRSNEDGYATRAKVRRLFSEVVEFIK